MSGLFYQQILLRGAFQRFWSRHRHDFHIVHFALNLFKQRAWRRLLFNLRLLSGLRSGYAAVFTQNGLVAADARHKVAGQTNQLVASIEVNAYTLLQALTATRLDAVQVVPTIGVEGVSEQGVAHDKPHLLAGHSRPQLVYHVLRNDIALLDVDFINPGE